MVNIKPGDLIRVITSGGLVVEGVVLPSTEFTSERHVVLKLLNGYNIGVSLENAVVEVIAEDYLKPGSLEGP
ncbi:MAG: hypothetical protein QW564_06850, partial [Sulfolobales archaeon]